MLDMETVVNRAKGAFASNRRTVESNLAELRVYARRRINFRHGYGREFNPIKRFFIYLFYLDDKRKLVPDMWRAHRKIRRYRKIEADLEQGILDSSIEALAELMPREETSRERVRRIRAGSSVAAIMFGVGPPPPDILRANMARLHNQLLQVQQGSTC